MTDRFDFWIHGINTVIDWKSAVAKTTTLGELSQDTKIGKDHFFIKQDNRGTLIKLTKKSGDSTEIYCYIAIPTATWLDDDLTDHYAAYLKAHCNIIEIQGKKGQAKIDEAWVIKGTQTEILHKYSPYKKFYEYDSATGLAPEYQPYAWDVPHERCDGALLIKLRISFRETGEEIWIIGAGARIIERT